MVNKIIKLINSDKSLVQETPYMYEGNYVPRVTTILSSMLHEDHLMGWSNYLGWKRMDYKATLQEAASKGTYVHNFIENKIKENQDPVMDLVPENIKHEVETAYASFISWWDIISKNNVKILMQEFPLVCPYFGGTLDILLEINGKVYLMDFKTSNHVSYKYFLQLSAYKYILEDYHGIKVDGVGVIMFNKKEIAFSEYILDFENNWDAEFMNVCINTFFGLVYSYYGRLRCENMFKEVVKKNDDKGEIIG